jgi:hypothetical protein
MAGGVVHEPTEWALAELRRRAPDFPTAAFARAIRLFPIERRRVAQPIGQVRQQLKSIAANAQALGDALASRGDELNAYLGSECAQYGDAMLPERIERDVCRLAILAANAEKEAVKSVSRGRDLSSTTMLVRRLARALAEAGVTADGRDNGPLVAAFDIARQELSLAVADSGDTVRKALRRETIA